MFAAATNNNNNNHHHIIINRQFICIDSPAPIQRNQFFKMGMMVEHVLLFRKIIQPNIFQSIRTATQYFRPYYHRNHCYEKWQLTILDTG